MLFADIDAAVFGSLTGQDRFQRNLQLAYADHLGGLMNNLRPSPFVPNTPDEARALARLELTELSNQIAAAMAGGVSDRMDHAHLLELQARVAATFDVGQTKSVK